MGSLAHLKSRVLDTMPAAAISVRQIGQHLESAIARYAAERFFFNIDTQAVLTAPGAPSVSAPGRLLVEDLVQLVDGASVYPLCKLTAEGLESRRLGSPAGGQPQSYAWRAGEAMALWPTPTRVQTLMVTGVYGLAPLSSDAATNAWTSEAADLIAACARKTLMRDLLGDPGGALSALQAEEEALFALRAQTVRRLSTGVMRAFP